MIIMIMMIVIIIIRVDNCILASSSNHTSVKFHLSPTTIEEPVSKNKNISSSSSSSSVFTTDWLEKEMLITMIRGRTEMEMKVGAREQQRDGLCPFGLRSQRENVFEERLRGARNIYLLHGVAGLRKQATGDKLLLLKRFLLLLLLLSSFLSFPLQFQGVYKGLKT